MLTLEERCKLATDCLPLAEYRTRLEALHTELLALRKDAEIGRWLLAKFEECSSGWMMEAVTINGAPSLETLEQAIGVAIRAG